MKAIIQRVRSASVVVDGQNIAKIGHGLLVLLGVTHQDTQDDVEWLSKKISEMRIFSDLKGQMNASVQDVDGGLLVVSQFTLMASTNKGNRPSFLDAARPERAMELYERFVKQLSLEAKPATVCARARHANNQPAHSPDFFSSLLRFSTKIAKCRLIR